MEAITSGRFIMGLIVGVALVYGWQTYKQRKAQQ